jgi:hypothetical protein
MANKTVIFVGGTSYSGSTFFDMTLANDPKGFSCGEVCALFFPYHPLHIQPDCGCADSECSIWHRLLKHGYANLFPAIFERFPEVDFIVDSSKDIFWITKQLRALKKHGIRAKHVLIWKDPFEAAMSFKKRNRLNQLERSWVNYHRLYTTCVPEFTSVSYRLLTTDCAYLKAVCDYLQIPCFEGKEQFWKKTHHTLFGNTSARVHLFQGDPGRQAICMKKLSEINAERAVRKRIRSIYYEANEDRELINWVSRRRTANPWYGKITRYLERRDVLSAETAPAGSDEKIGMPYPCILRSRLRTYWLRSKFRMKQGLDRKSVPLRIWRNRCCHT